MDPPGIFFDVSYRTLTPVSMEEDQLCETDEVMFREDSTLSPMPVDPEFQPERHKSPNEMFSESRQSSPATAALKREESENEIFWSPGEDEIPTSVQTEPNSQALDVEDHCKEPISQSDSGGSERPLSAPTIEMDDATELQSSNEQEAPVNELHDQSQEAQSEESQIRHLETETSLGDDSATSDESNLQEASSPNQAAPKRSRYEKILTHIQFSDDNTEPGAYLVTKIKQEGREVVKITVPADARPNELFEVRLGNRHVRLVCPSSARPGWELLVQVDKEDRFKHILLKPAILTASPAADKFFGSFAPGNIGGAYRMLPDLKKVYRDAKGDAPNVRTK